MLPTRFHTSLRPVKSDFFIPISPEKSWTKHFKVQILKKSITTHNPKNVIPIQRSDLMKVLGFFRASAFTALMRFLMAGSTNVRVTGCWILTLPRWLGWGGRPQKKHEKGTYSGLPCSAPYSVNKIQGISQRMRHSLHFHSSRIHCSETYSPSTAISCSNMSLRISSHSEINSSYTGSKRGNINPAFSRCRLPLLI